jgi:Flp pilus assembly protein TadD/4-amino-4-deoxy-L-arabinose transferase-like glycosyltransferase
VLLAGWGAALAAVVLWLHGTPTYYVETDLMGVYIPAARALRAGHVVAEQYQFHGVGYPALLAALGALAGGDDWLAARLLNVIAAVSAAWLTFELVRGTWSARVGVFALLALIATPAFLRSAVEVGTDMPTLALALGATLLVLRGRGAGALAASGLLAGYAIITRYNAVSLPLAGLAVVLLRPASRRRAAAYLAGLLVPLVAWLAVGRLATGAPLANQNYLNVAWEFFGRSVRWERFVLVTGPQFRSFGDVLGYDPARFVTHLAANLATRWWRDATELMSPWLGCLALPGLLLMLRGRRGAGGLALHAALAYAVLAFAFYSPRFFLYLLPFYVGGAAALVLEARWPRRAPTRRAGAGGPASRPEPQPVALARAGVLAVLVLVSGGRAVAETRALLAGAPTETRSAGAWLRAQGLGGRIYARKPNVAYFAGMEYVPLPDVVRPGDLLRAGRAASVGYLFLSPIELGSRPQYQLVAAARAPLPGLELLQREAPSPAHSYSLYRLGGGAGDAVALDSALVATGERGSVGPGASTSSRLNFVGTLIDLGRAQEALPLLAALERENPRTALVARWQAVAYTALADYGHAAAACRRAIALGSDNGWERGHLGMALVMLGRYREALEPLGVALEQEPANAEYVEDLAIAHYYLGDLAAALGAFERSRALHPGDEEALYYIGRILLLRGDRARAVALLQGARAAAAFSSPELAGLADSLGVRPGR